MRRIGYIAACLLFLAGCMAGDQMGKVNTGMSREQVIGILGRPDGAAVLGGNEVLTWSNRGMSVWSDWAARADYHVILIDGRVTAYGQGAVRQGPRPNVLMIVPLR